MRRLCALVLSLIGLTFAGSSAFAANFQVTKTEDTADGVCDGDCSLREAIIAANLLAGGDVVNVPAGTYRLAISGGDEDAAATGDLDITDEMTLAGAGAGLTTIDADGLDRVLQVLLLSNPSFAVTIMGVTITGGLVRDDPGGPAALGGGIFSLGGHLSILGSTISANSADDGGGGVYRGLADDLTIRESSVTGNTAPVGGGVYLDCVKLTLIDSTISNNTATGDGGGILASSNSGIFACASKLTVMRSAIIANEALRGGGVILFRGAGGRVSFRGLLRASNSTFSKNKGGGIESSQSTVVLTHTTVSANTSGGFVASGGLDTWLSLTSTILADQAAGADCVRIAGTGILVSSQRHNLDSDGSCDLTGPTDMPNADPLLGPLQDNGGPTWTHALLPGSPAIDAIPENECTWDDDRDPRTPEVPVATDQRGARRPQSPCDIGAYEANDCADGVNNDGDAFMDYPADPGCRDAVSVTESPECQDGINNDPGEDDFIDFDGGLSALGYVAAAPDPQCKDKPWRDCEFATCCGLGFELALILPALMWLRRRRHP